MLKSSRLLLGVRLLGKTNKSSTVVTKCCMWTKPQVCNDLSNKSDKFDNVRIQSVHTTPCCSCQDVDQDKINRDPTKDRTKVIPFETSQRYLKSEAYKSTYGDEFVWIRYRRNFKGQFPSKKTRPTCIKEGMIISGNPCPICRDEFLVVDFRNVDLLKQFVSPYTDQVLPWSKTNVCQAQQRNLEVAIDKARLHGLLTFYVPFREYNYKDYYDPKTE